MISLTGSTGFVGKNLSTYLKQNQMVIEYITRHALNDVNFYLSDKVDCLVHLAGKAHDLKKTPLADEYYKVNTELTIKIFDAFMSSNAKVFIMLSSVKAVADDLVCELTEEFIPNPITHYGKSKFLAEQYLLSKVIPNGKRVYILRPCMIHGPGNKGNLNLLFKIVSKKLPWPLGAFENRRSFCSIDNLSFIINELIVNDQIPSGIYNIADDDPISTNELINLISESINKQPFIWKIPKRLIIALSKLGDFLRLPLNTDRLKKLSETYVVSNQKIKIAINKSLPISAKEGLIKTFQSYNH